MVSQLKETLIENNNANLQNELIEVEELKQELIVSNESEEQHIENEHDELYNILNNSSIKVLDDKVEVNSSLKKKEEDLLKMKLADLKTLAKKKNIPLMESNKPKKKETLVQNLLDRS